MSTNPAASNNGDPVLAEQNLWIATEKNHWLDRLTMRVGDWINPIVIKEMRQSLKSRQFAFTFFLTLIFGLLYSLLSVSIFGGSHYPTGNEVIVGYIWILAFPLIVIVPFFTFRSMISENEDNTYELLAITTLRPRQIIWGKLASGLLQITIYVSLISPCIVFSYMLREISLLTVLLIIFIMVYASVAFCVVGLFMATISHSRPIQIFFSVLIVLGLGWSYLAGCAGLTEGLTWGGFDPDLRHIIALTGPFAIIGTYVILLLAAATSRLKFLGDNRSTGIRIVLMVQQAVAIAVIVWASITSWSEVLAAGYACIALHWLVIGSIMLGERKVMSDRVQRGLPHDTFSRTFFSWFMPGADRGLLFVVANLIGAAVAICAITYFRSVDFFGMGVSNHDYDIPATTVIRFVTAWALYAITYLMIVGFLVELCRKHVPAAHLQILSFFLMLLLVAACVFVPLTIQSTFFYKSFRGEFSPIQFPNVFWTTSEIIDNYRASFRGTNFTGNTHIAVLYMATTSLPLIFFTLLRIGRNIQFAPAVAPEQVLQQQLALQPEQESSDPFADEN